MKVVLTGEGADELLAGYSVFKEDRVRRFWARRPDSAVRPALFARLHPEVQAGGARATDMWARFFGRDLAAVDQPFYAHLVRWSNTAWTTRLLHPDLRAAAADAARRLGRRRRPARRDAPRVLRLGPAGPGPVGRDRHVHVVVPAGLAGRPGGHGPRGRGALPVPRSRGGRLLQRVAARAQARRPARQGDAAPSGVEIAAARDLAPSQAALPGAHDHRTVRPRGARLRERADVRRRHRRAGPARPQGGPPAARPGPEARTVRSPASARRWGWWGP